ncbi:MAG: DUF1109 domain-containing protein [Methylovirgula sp.]|uniref:DUF1109 domain-containing protein n=1 Tax=Methylovirgula sp. TaxID=1978224 RepID=UPI00307609BA
MKTDDLIDVLGTNVEPVGGSHLRLSLIMTLVVGASIALCLVLAIFGVPKSEFGPEFSALKLVGLAFTCGLVLAGAGYLFRAARPGDSSRVPFAFIVLLFLAIFFAAFVVLALVHMPVRQAMLFGQQWVPCLICIPLLAIVPFVLLVLTLRKEAPTNLTWTGAVAGLVAGALGAAAFAFHHPGGSLPFIAFWYGGSIILCVIVGAALGPRLLRW